MIPIFLVPESPITLPDAATCNVKQVCAGSDLPVNPPQTALAQVRKGPRGRKTDGRIVRFDCWFSCYFVMSLLLLRTSLDSLHARIHGHQWKKLLDRIGSRWRIIRSLGRAQHVERSRRDMDPVPGRTLSVTGRPHRGATEA